MNRNRLTVALSVLLLAFTGPAAVCQNVMPDVLNKGSLPDQMKFLEEKTRIYENYRAIREDMFQKIKGNVLDSLNITRGRITGYIGMTGTLNSRITSLMDTLSATRSELKEVTRTKNNISVIGIGLNKVTYNAIMWIIVAGLLFLLGIGFLIFKRNRIITVRAQNELREVNNEFEEYRKKTRLEREKMSMDHFKEIQKLRGEKK